MSVVVVGDADPEMITHIEASARAACTDVGAAVRLAARLGSELPLPGSGKTASLWSALATLGSVDLTVARIVEPHLDAIGILEQAGVDTASGSTWGVYAAERQGLALRFAEGHLEGVKPWCSLADRLDRALVTALVPAGRQLFAVDLRHPGVDVESGAWHARGLATVTSTSVSFDHVPAQPVGAPGWYLDRPGFAWGGMGVAACWYGGAVALAATLLASTRTRRPDQIALAGLGELDRTLHAVRTVLAAAAEAVDGGCADGVAGAALAERVRGLAAAAAETALRVVGHLLGPGPLSFDEEHARRVADLTLYIRQHHAARDDARLGALIQDAGPAW